jgi:hypothetical protein
VSHSSAIAGYSHRTWHSMSLECVEKWYILVVALTKSLTDGPAVEVTPLRCHQTVDRFSDELWMVDGGPANVGCLGQDVVRRDAGGQFQVAVGDGDLGVGNADHLAMDIQMKWRSP